jgi:hypothetical protein
MSLCRVRGLASASPQGAAIQEGRSGEVLIILTPRCHWMGAIGQLQDIDLGWGSTV